MKYILLVLILVTQCLSPAIAETLSEKDRKEINNSIDKLSKSMYSKDPQVVADFTFDPLIAAVGGRKKYIESLNANFKSFDEQEIKFVSYTNEFSDNLNKSNQYFVCTIREVTTIEKLGQKFQVHGFTLAMKKISGGGWKFIGGGGISKNPKILNILLPGLDKDFKIPEVEIRGI